MTNFVKPKVLLLGKVIYAVKEWEALSDVAELAVLESKSRTEFFQDLKGKYSDVVGIFRTAASKNVIGLFDKELANELPESVKYVCHRGAGYDQIDVQHFTPRGIKVSHTPGAVDAPTADAHLYLILGALRNFAHGSYQLRQKEWVKDVIIAHDPAGKVLGIVGMGGIGRALRDRCAPLGFTKIIYYNRNRLAPELEKDAVYVDNVEELLSLSDVISLNCPLNDATYHLINRERIALMKDGVVITNTSRGKVIDEEALVEALETGKVGAVGLDVFESEPIVHPGLLANPRALLLPHMGTHTIESRTKMEILVIDNLRSGITKGELITIVPEQKDAF